MFLSWHSKWCIHQLLIIWNVLHVARVVAEVIIGTLNRFLILLTDRCCVDTPFFSVLHFVFDSFRIVFCWYGRGFLLDFFVIDFEIVNFWRGAWLLSIKCLTCIAIPHLSLVNIGYFADSLKHFLIILFLNKVVAGSYLIMFVIFDTFHGLFSIKFMIFNNLLEVFLINW